MDFLNGICDNLNNRKKPENRKGKKFLIYKLKIIPTLMDRLQIITSCILKSKSFTTEDGTGDKLLLFKIKFVVIFN